MSDMLGELHRVIGQGPTEALLVRYGGVHLRIPQKARPGHPIGHVIGVEAFTQLVHTFGGELLSLPNRKRQRLEARNATIAFQRMNGVSIEQLARDYSLTTRQIFSILSRHRSLAS